MTRARASDVVASEMEVADLRDRLEHARVTENRYFVRTMFGFLVVVVGIVGGIASASMVGWASALFLGVLQAFQVRRWRAAEADVEGVSAMLDEASAGLRALRGEAP